MSMATVGLDIVTRAETGRWARAISRGPALAWVVGEPHYPGVKSVV